MRNILIVLLCYFIGNISFSYILTKIKLNEDIRKFGSGNAGTTNVLRVLGKKCALLVLIGDILKGVLAVVIAKLFLAGEIGIILCGLAVILGHNWPIVMGFRGGKGVATTIGVFAVYDPILTLLCACVGILVIVITRYVSLGSITGMAIAPIVSLMLKRTIYGIVFALLIGSIAIYKHRSNISRLIKGNENKIKF